jgi:hypothetical protein
LAVGDSGHLAGRPGVWSWHDWLFEGDVMLLDGLPLTRPERSVSGAAARARSLEDAVRVIDMAAVDDLVSLAELEAYAQRIRGRPGTRLFRAALELADENAWSPQEVAMRVRWKSGRACHLLCNRPVFDLQGRHLLTPDVLDPSAGVAGEYNGALHDEAPIRRRDLDREDLCRDIGLEVVSMMSSDHRDVSAFERRLAAAYRRARGRSVGRCWTLEQPAWWVDTSTVESRRALDDATRQRWLPWARD